MKPHQKCIATKSPFVHLLRGSHRAARRGHRTLSKALLLLALLFGGAAAHAQVAGTVANLSGPLLARKADGTVKILSLKSTVEQGDTLVSEKDTYARIKFIDDSEITLRPNSQIKIDSFVFEEAAPEKDSAVFSLVKGGLRAVTGALGKRSKEKVGVSTPTATIGIRGTTFIAEYIPPTQTPVTRYGAATLAAAEMTMTYGGQPIMSDIPRTVAPLEMLPPKEPMPLQLAQAPVPGNSRPPGLYVHVLDGIINVSNPGGNLNFMPGQFGYTASLQQPPIILPANPGIQFTPPPAFSASTGPQTGPGATRQTESVDCEVR
jgi:hypothetical protein